MPTINAPVLEVTMASLHDFQVSESLPAMGNGNIFLQTLSAAAAMVLDLSSFS